MFLTSGLTITGGLTIGTPSDSTSPRNALLLSGNYGVNNGTNNTFLDSSSYAQTVTRNGDTTQGSFSPYDFNYSVFFNGSSDFLQLPSNTAFVLGTGNFTIEAWVYLNTLTGNQTIIDMRAGTTAAVAPLLWATGSTFRFYTIGADRITSSTISAGTWYHVAVVRNFGTTTMYLNGTATGSTYADTNSYVINNPFIGRFSDAGSGFMNGYISNLRITRGQALYTATFTPPTATLTTTSQAATASNVAALVCQSNRFIDNSPNNFTVTVNSTPQITGFSPFVLPYSYNPDAENAFYVGSGYFDGAGDCLTVPSNATFAFGTGNFTIECWVYLSAYNGTYGSQIFGGHNYGVGADLIFMVNTTGKLYFQISGSSTGAITSTSSVSLNTWTHVAVVRSGGTVTPYINGTNAGGGASYTTSVSSTINPGIGSSSNNNNAAALTGYISNLRVVNGTAVYTTAFAPPTLPVSTVNNTVLLLNFTNSNIPDYTMNNNLVTVGDAKLSTAVTRYNPYSIAFDGSVDYLTIPANQTLILGGRTFTMEAWVYINSSSEPYQHIFKYSGGNNMMFIDFFSGVPGRLGCSAGATTAWSPSGITVNTWHHVAVVRNGTSVTAYLNGVGGTPQTIDPGPTTATTAIMGWDTGSAPARYLNGYIDDFRITQGLARYTANFTPPQGPLPLA
jgi:hypothetical protein